MPALQIKEREIFDLLQKADVCKMDVGSIFFTDKADFYLDSFVRKQNWLPLHGRVCLTSIILTCELMVTHKTEKHAYKKGSPSMLGQALCTIVHST